MDPFFLPTAELAGDLPHPPPARASAKRTNSRLLPGTFTPTSRRYAVPVNRALPRLRINLLEPQSVEVLPY